MTTKQLHDHIINNVLIHLPDISSRPMFGGYGYYQNGFIFGILAAGKLYFKVDNSNRADYQQANMGPFIYAGSQKPVSTSYWEVPQAVQQDPQLISEWIAKSVSISRAKKKLTK